MRSHRGRKEEWDSDSRPGEEGESVSVKEARVSGRGKRGVKSVRGVSVVCVCLCVKRVERRARDIESGRSEKKKSRRPSLSSAPIAHERRQQQHFRRKTI